MAQGRRMWAALKLLDRQIVDRDGRLAGNVDDVVLTDVDGQLMVTGVRTGPGALVYRLGGKRMGQWLRRMHDVLDGHDGVVPIGQVSSVGNHVTVALEGNDLPSERHEIWFRDHVIARIPGSNHAAE